MDGENALLQAFIFLAAAVIAVPIAKKLGFGSVLGYLLAGAIIGPFGLRLLGDPEGAMHAAEFGVVIMLFLIGLELQPRLLWRMRMSILGMGGAQVVLTAVAGATIAMAFNLDWRMALAVGLILALSSTAIVMQSLRERGLDKTDAGRGAFSVLLFQDIAIIPIIALLPLLATLPAGDGAHGGKGGVLGDAPAHLQALAILGAVGAIILVGRVLLRPAFRIVANTGLREIFTAFALAIVVGVALLMQIVGLSPALGAFVAGVVLADSEFRHELEGDIDPFRGLLLGVFFIAVGAAIDFALIAAQPLLILGLVALLISVKAATLFIIALAFKHRAGDAAFMGLALAQGGEFAFVLIGLASAQGALSVEVSKVLLVVVALSMAVTPLLLIAANAIMERLLASKENARAPEVESDEPHVLVAGYGRFGQTVGRLLNANGWRTSVIDHDADQVELLRGFGRKVNYGDATRIDLMRLAGAEHAKALVIAIDDKERALHLAEAAQKHFPHLKIFARAFDRRHAYELLARKVDGLERETFEGGVRLGVAVMRGLGQTAHQAERAGRLFRRYDDKLLKEMSQYWGDDFAAYQRAVRDRTALSEQLMQRDIADLRAGFRDEAWDTDSLDAEVRAMEAASARKDGESEA
jgi:glutathione-regulated potassium-efflux system ancillary protein KefC/glutathione-regulated potassium-efflux system protein KefB